MRILHWQIYITNIYICRFCQGENLKFWSKQAGLARRFCGGLARRFSCLPVLLLGGPLGRSLTPMANAKKRIVSRPFTSFTRDAEIPEKTFLFFVS